MWSERNVAQRCFVVERKMIKISLLKIILSFAFMQKQKIPVMNFTRGAAMEPQGRHFASHRALFPHAA